MRAMRGVVGRDAEQPSLGAVGVRTSGASARGRRVVGAGGGGAGAGAGRGEPVRVGEALGDEGAEGEDDDDRGLGERGGLKVVEDAELEAGEDDWGVGSVVDGGGGGGWGYIPGTSMRMPLVMTRTSMALRVCMEGRMLRFEYMWVTRRLMKRKQNHVMEAARRAR